LSARDNPKATSVPFRKGSLHASFGFRGLGERKKK
jgi:hypothetical protein